MSNNNTNGAVNRGTVINTGVALISIIGILYVAYVANGLDEKFSKFVNMWENRIKVSNIINNGTRDVIKDEIRNFAGNLSQHRIVTNATFDEVKLIENHTANLIRSFNSTNEEERGKAVEEIVDTIYGLADALNVTITPKQQTNSTENVSEEEILRLFKELQDK